MYINDIQHKLMSAVGTFMYICQMVFKTMNSVHRQQKTDVQLQNKLCFTSPPGDAHSRV